MNNKNYKLGMVLQSIKNGYQIEIVEIFKTPSNKTKYKVKYLNSVNVYKEIGNASLDKYYKVVR